MAVRFEHLDKAELDRQLSPSLAAKDAGGVLSRHATETEALWDEPLLSVERNLQYAPQPAALLDIVRPKGNGPFPCLAFVHGGFWQEGSKAGSGFAARALAEAGWATALIGYTLAPQARLSEIVEQVGVAIAWLADNAAPLRLDPDRLVLAGHSAGAHMAAAVIAGKAGPSAARTPAGAVLISGVFDLAPIAASYVNDAVGMDEEEIRNLSLLDARPVCDIPVHVLVGADETPAFIAQSDALQQNWSVLLEGITRHDAPGRDHFDILDELADASSPSFREILEMGA